MPSRVPVPRSISPQMHAYSPAPTRSRRRQNHIPDELVPADPLNYPAHAKFPCAASTMRSIDKAITNKDHLEFFLRAYGQTACDPVTFPIGQPLWVRHLVQGLIGPIWSQWARAIVIARGVQRSIIGIEFTWYDVRLRDVSEMRRVIPILGETWDERDFHPSLTAINAGKLDAQLRCCLVPEYVFDYAWSRWVWEWTPARIQGSLAAPNLTVLFFRLSKAAEKHDQHSIDSVVGTAGNRGRRIENPPHPVHAIWAVPWTKDIVTILERHECILAPEARG
ncbi:hypothetical protein BV25DRAFT_1914454 [Artomyces pyxidatus]|uniref:Uncharacterized protein n=1 Tax=Artomyces pyxidatus TaxID=48021 RepID=A0ACB8T6S8_9AGAM|nr:hypothetical protein BV25DRAFT_1914454 [Artomyces pyxidatus]